MRRLAALAVALAATAAPDVACGADYYVSNKPGSGLGTKAGPIRKTEGSTR